MSFWTFITSTWLLISITSNRLLYILLPDISLLRNLCFKQAICHTVRNVCTPWMLAVVCCLHASDTPNYKQALVPLSLAIGLSGEYNERKKKVAFCCIMNKWNAELKQDCCAVTYPDLW
jgi:hypothetical protein